jgi:hypothetical protein
LSDREGRARERRRSILEDGHPEMIFKDLLGNIMEHAAVVALAESVGQGSSEVRRLYVGEAHSRLTSKLSSSLLRLGTPIARGDTACSPVAGDGTRPMAA